MAPMEQLLTAMCTPMHDDGSVNYEGAATLAEHLVENGSDGVVVCGTTGESPTLTDDEKVGLFDAVVQAVKGKGTVWAGTGSYDTAVSVELTRRAERTGVDGIMAVVPYYNRPPQEGLTQHFLAVARATDLPVMLYNVPTRTAANVLPATVAQVAEKAANVVAIKEAAGDMGQVTELRRLLGPRFRIYSGDDPLTLPMLAVGANGIVSVAGHVVGKPIQQMIEAFKAGRVEEAAAMHGELFPVFQALFVTTNPIPVKWSMGLLGMDLGPFRLPLVPPTDSDQAHIKKVFAKYGLIDV